LSIARDGLIVLVLCLTLAEHTLSIIEEKGKRASKGWNNGIRDSGVPFIDGMVLTLLLLC
jgi:hypothetical protein